MPAHCLNMCRVWIRLVSAIYVTSGSLDHGTFVFEKRGVVTFVGCVALRRTSHPLKFQKVSAAHDGIGGWRTKHAIIQSIQFSLASHARLTSKRSSGAGSPCEISCASSPHHCNTIFAHCGLSCGNGIWTQRCRNAAEHS